MIEFASQCDNRQFLLLDGGYGGGSAAVADDGAGYSGYGYDHGHNG